MVGESLNSNFLIYFYFHSRNIDGKQKWKTIRMENNVKSLSLLENKEMENKNGKQN